MMLSPCFINFTQTKKTGISLNGDFGIRPVEYRLQVHVFRAGSSDDYTCRQNDFNTYVSLTSKAMSTLYQTVFRVDMKNTSRHSMNRNGPELKHVVHTGYSWKCVAIS